MKESKKCYIISWACWFLALVSLWTLVVASINGWLINIIGGIGLTLAGAWLAIAFRRVGKNWKRLGD